MRPLFKVVYTIIGILLAIFIVVKVVNSFKSTPPIPNDATTELGKYTSQLKDLEKQIKADVDSSDTLAPICIIDRQKYIDLINDINTVKNKVNDDKLYENADTDTRTAYDGIVKPLDTFTANTANLLDCSEYCYQGKLDGTNPLQCVCQQQYSIPIIYKDSNGKERVYCWDSDCELQPHRQFVPGSSRDPSTNKCNCMTGFVEKDGNCVAQRSPEDQKLAELTTKINEDIDNFNNKFFFCKIDVADAIIDDLGNLEKAAGALIDGNIFKDTLEKYKSAKKIADALIDKYNGLPKCDEYCGNTAKYEEDTNPGACVCNDRHAIFNPNSTSDNKCTSCDVGYEQGLNKCVTIRNNNSDTGTLFSHTSSINQFTKDIVAKCTYCISQETFNDKQTIIDELKADSELIIKRNNPGPSLESYNAYNTEITASTNAINKIKDKDLPQCDEYCWQAKYNATNNDCECATGTTQVTNSGKIYCYVCGKNSHPVFPNPPSKEPSPITNCECDTNFGICNTPGVCENCTEKLKSENDLLQTDYTNIQNSVSNNIDVYGTFTAGKLVYNIKPRSNIQSSNSTEKKTVRNGILDCASYLLGEKDAFSYLPGSLSDNCILYTTNNATNTVTDEISIYGYKVSS
jgi:hypothetical protein